MSDKCKKSLAHSKKKPYLCARCYEIAALFKSFIKTKS